MRTLRISRLLPLLLLLCGLTSASSAEVLKIVVNDTIQPITLEYIDRAIEQAGRNHDEALLIELNTPGGLLDSTREIIEKILASPVPVIIYVTPSGSRAASAGFFILESADVAAMAPGTNTGAAHPVTLGGGKMDDVMKTKIENDSAALMRSVVSKRGRNVEIAETTVRESKSFTDQEALKDHLIDYVASSQEDLFKQIATQPVKRFSGQSVSLNLANQPVRDYDMTLKQHILAYIMDPNVAFILLAIGALALYAEFNHPGRRGSGNGRRDFHSARHFRVEPAAHALCGRGLDSGVVHTVRAGSEIRDPRRAGDWRDRDHDSGRAASGGCTHSRDAGPPADGPGHQHTAGRHHRVSDGHRPARSPQ